MRSKENFIPELEKKKSEMDDIKVVQNFGYWYLCATAESCMQEAIDDEGVILVNDTFLLKMNGRLAGFPIKREGVEGGEIRPDRWYTPEDKEVRREIREAFDQGKKKISLNGKTNWVQVRNLDIFSSADDYGTWPQTNEEYLSMIQEAAGKILEHKDKEIDPESEWDDQCRKYRMRNEELDDNELDYE